MNFYLDGSDEYGEPGAHTPGAKTSTYYRSVSQWHGGGGDALTPPQLAHAKTQRNYHETNDVYPGGGPPRRCCHWEEPEIEYYIPLDTLDELLSFQRAVGMGVTICTVVLGSYRPDDKGTVRKAITIGSSIT